MPFLRNESQDSHLFLIFRFFFNTLAVRSAEGPKKAAQLGCQVVPFTDSLCCARKKPQGQMDPFEGEIFPGDWVSPPNGYAEPNQMQG